MRTFGIVGIFVHVCPEEGRNHVLQKCKITIGSALTGYMEIEYFFAAKEQAKIYHEKKYNVFLLQRDLSKPRVIVPSSHSQQKADDSMRKGSYGDYKNNFYHTYVT